MQTSRTACERKGRLLHSRPGSATVPAAEGGRIGWRLAAAALSGALLALAFPPYRLWWLAWVGLVPLINAAPGLRARHAFYVGVVGGIVFAAITLPWLFNIFHAGAISLFFIFGLFFGIFAACVAATDRWPGPRWWPLTIPCFWVLTELLRAEDWPLRFTWMSLGYSLAERLGPLQWAAIVGCYGLSGVIACANGLVAAALRLKTQRAPWPKSWLLALSVYGVLLWPFMSVPHSEDRRTVPVTLVQLETRTWDGMIELTEAANPPPGSLVVWPEYAIPLDVKQNPLVLEDIQKLVRARQVYLVFGTQEYIKPPADHPWWNTALILAPTGEPIGAYHKINPVHFFDDGTPGREYPVFDAPWGRFGIVICFDLDFEKPARRVVANGGELLVVPNFDAMSWGRLQHVQHTAMTAMRAVELRRWIVRAASSGASQIVDPWGRIDQSLPVFGEGLTLQGNAELMTERSPYVRGGWLFPRVLQVLGVLILLAAVWRGRRARAQSKMAA